MKNSDSQIFIFAKYINVFAYVSAIRRTPNLRKEKAVSTGKFLLGRPAIPKHVNPSMTSYLKHARMKMKTLTLKWIQTWTK